MPAGDQHTNSHRIACFVSPHGFGHAARLSAVADAVYRNLPDCRFDIFTSVPAWFFRNSLAAPFTYHSAETDLGLVSPTHTPQFFHSNSAVTALLESLCALLVVRGGDKASEAVEAFHAARWEEDIYDES